MGFHRNEKVRWADIESITVGFIRANHCAFAWIDPELLPLARALQTCLKLCRRKQRLDFPSSADTLHEKQPRLVRREGKWVVLVRYDHVGLTRPCSMLIDDLALSNSQTQWKLFPQESSECRLDLVTFVSLVFERCPRFSELRLHLRSRRSNNFFKHKISDRG